MENIVTVIQNFGFPVACVIMMWYLLNKEREDHKAETKELTGAINDLRLVIQKVLDKLGVDDGNSKNK